MAILHTVDTWFKDKTLLDYYNNDFTSNVIGKFKIPRKILNKWLDDNPNITETTLLEKVINAIGQVAINSIIISMPAKGILPKIPFHWLELESDTMHCLRQAVCSYILNASVNDQFYERLNGSTMTSSAFNLTQETTNWLLQGDALNVDTKNWIDKSGIAHYVVIGANDVWTYSKDGLVYIVGSIDAKVIKELSL